MGLKRESKWLRRQMLLERKQIAEASGNTVAKEDISRMMQHETKRSTWPRINCAVDEPRLGAIRKVQRIEGGVKVEIGDKEEMEHEIQVVTEHRFDLAHSAPATASSLVEKLGYLSNTDFADLFVRGKASVPDDVDEKTKLIMEEIARLGMGLETFDGEQTVMTKEKF